MPWRLQPCTIKDDHNLVTSGLFVKPKRVVKMKRNVIILAMLKLIGER
jgi:hypothetical protein